MPVLDKESDRENMLCELGYQTLGATDEKLRLIT